MKQREIKILRFFTVVCILVLIIAQPLALFAQDGIVQEDPDLPCDNLDIYADCPLDGWTIILLAAGLLAGMYYIYKGQYHRRKAIDATAKNNA